MNIAGFVAVEESNLMGLNGAMPWPVNTEDMRWFSTMTRASNVLIGRKTFESLDVTLQERQLWVLSQKSPDGSAVTTKTNVAWSCISVDSFFSQLKQEPVKANSYGRKVSVVGGAEVFLETFRYMESMYVTEVTLTTEVKDTDDAVYFPMCEMLQEFNRRRLVFEGKTGVKVYRYYREQA